MLFLLAPYDHMLTPPGRPHLADEQPVVMEDVLSGVKAGDPAHEPKPVLALFVINVPLSVLGANGKVGVVARISMAKLSSILVVNRLLECLHKGYLHLSGPHVVHVVRAEHVGDLFLGREIILAVGKGRDDLLGLIGRYPIDQVFVIFVCFTGYVLRQEKMIHLVLNSKR